MNNRPNIIIVMTDQMRASAMGFTDQEKVMTPNLDRFTKASTCFCRAVSNNPACTPARASFITGLYPLSHGLVNNDVRLGTHFKTLAHCLNDMDYKCGYIGKWHMDNEDRGAFIPPGPRRQGFDDFWAAYNCNHEYYNGYYYLNDNPEPVWIDGYEPFAQTELAKEYIKEKSEKNEHFCLYVSYGPPHCPYLEVPRKYLDMYPTDSIELKPNALGVASVDKQVIAGYYAHITALDECFGQIMDSISNSGIEDNTIVLFTSDHGDMLFSQDRGWKGKPWLESVNIPFLIKWKGHIPSNSLSNGLIGLVDVMPTLISMIGGTIPDGVEGLDLSELVFGNENASPDSAFIGFYVIPDFFSYKEWRGVITQRYTYATFKEKPWLLYDDVKDPYQLNNLVDNPNYGDIKNKLDKLTGEWLEKLNDPFETSIEVADKYTKGHEGGVIPHYENEVIKVGKLKRTDTSNDKADISVNRKKWWN